MIILNKEKDNCINIDLAVSVHITAENSVVAEYAHSIMPVTLAAYNTKEDAMLVLQLLFNAATQGDRSFRMPNEKTLKYQRGIKSRRTYLKP